MPAFSALDLDETIHARPRLAVMSLLTTRGPMDFTALRDQLGVTDGSLGMHLRRLLDRGYIAAKRDLHSRRPRTVYSPTARGLDAFDRYLGHLAMLFSA